MLNEIIAGVSMKLADTFGKTYKIYQSNVPQGVKQPCFFIAVLSPEQSPFLGQRYLSRNPLDVRYIPRNGANRSELYDMAAQLLETLEFITLRDGDILRGTSMQYELADGVLHFFVTYTLPLRRWTEETDMETLQVGIGTKEG